MADRRGLAQASKLVRRMTLDNKPELTSQVAQVISDQGWDAGVDFLVDRPLDTSTLPKDKSGVYKSFVIHQAAWLDLAKVNNNPVQDRMAFFWQTILTSNYFFVGQHRQILAEQIERVRAIGMTNYRDMLHAHVIDPLLMRFLSAQENWKDEPNENLARELMELFTFGKGNYTEEDVRNTALAIGGWVLRDNHIPEFKPARAYSGQLTILGQTRAWDIRSVTDNLLDNPLTAKRISGLFWAEMMGEQTPAPENLGREWFDLGYDITWLVKRVLKSQEFVSSPHYVRPRSGFEYYMNVNRLLQHASNDESKLYNLGQSPWRPPNVSGWPGFDRWHGVSSTMARANLVSEGFNDAAPDTSVDEILDQCGIYEISDSTLNLLNSAGQLNGASSAQEVTRLRWWLALSSPEANLT